MLGWIVGSYAVLSLVLTGCAGYVTLFVADADRRKHAFEVLKYVLAVLTGGAGVFALLERLHQAGVI